MPKKDNVRDYATSAFRFYSAMGRPDPEQIEILREQLSNAAILDLVAVSKVMQTLDEQSKYEAISAIEEIYFLYPKMHLCKSELTERVIKFSIDNYIAERKVWQHLKTARMLFAKMRDLHIQQDI